MPSTYLFTEVGQPGSAQTLATPGHSIGGNTFKVGSTANWPAVGKSVVFAVDTYTNQTIAGQTVQVRDSGSYTEWIADVTDATTLSNAAILYGSDQNYPAATTTRVYIPVSSSRENRLVQALLTEHTQLGKHSAITTTSITNAGALTNNGSIVANGGLQVPTGQVANILPALSNPYKFSVRLGTSQATAQGTIVIFDTKNFDTGSNYSTTTGKFTAPVAGFYQFSGSIQVNGGGGFVMGVMIFKNGSEIARGSEVPNTTSNNYTLPFACLLQLSAGDTISINLLSNNSGNTTVYGSFITQFNGFLVSAT